QKANASYLNMLGPGFRVLRQVGNRMLGHRRFPKGMDTSDNQARVFRGVLAKSIDLLRGRQVVILKLNGLSGINPRFPDAAGSRTADLGLDLTFVDVSTVLTAQDFFTLDPHMHPSGHE